mgnify:CR=1 FL=1
MYDIVFSIIKKRGKLSMKKVTRILTSFVLCLSLCLSMAACGGKKESSSDGNSTALEEYISESQSQIDEMSSALEGQGMDLSVEVRGNSLAYVYQFTTDVGDTETIKSGLEQSMSAMEETFNTLLSQVKEEVSETESMIVEYLDMDGNVIYSKEFK